MANEFSHLTKEEQLQAENEFIKMKLMLEKGAQFGTVGEMENFPVALENEFLKQILEFEEQQAHPVLRTIFEKLNKPSHFPPAGAIPDKEIEPAWKELSAYLEQYGIKLYACSPRVSSRELYRFTLEELFKLEINVRSTGMTHNFIYDEFYPDPVYESSRLVEQNLFKDIFSINKLFCGIFYNSEGFVFNNRSFTHRQEYIDLINRFKSSYDKIDLDECNITQCTVNEDRSEIEGHYAVTAKAGRHSTVFTGHFTVNLNLDEMGDWNFERISIEGFDLR